MSMNIQLQTQVARGTAQEVAQYLDRIKATESVLQSQFVRTFIPEKHFQVTLKERERISHRLSLILPSIFFFFLSAAFSPSSFVIPFPCHQIYLTLSGCAGR
jgi:hypothetical protein